MTTMTTAAAKAAEPTRTTAIASLHLLAELEGHSSRAWHLAWNPRMPILASCSGDKDVRLHAYSFVSTTSAQGASTCKHPSFNLREVIPTGHQRTVRQVAWSPDGKSAVSGGLDTNLCVWSLADPGKRVRMANANKDGIGGVAWAAKEKVISAGADAAVKTWKVQGLI